MPKITDTTGFPTLGLTKKQLMFCEEYLSNGFNQTKAAEAAGYKTNKGNNNNLSNIGAHLLQDEKIKEYLKIRLETMNNKFDEIIYCLTAIVLNQETDQIPLLEQGSQYLANKKIDARDRVKAASELIKYREFLMKLEREDIDREDRRKNDNIILENLVRQLAKEERELNEFELIDEEGE